MRSGYELRCSSCGRIMVVTARDWDEADADAQAVGWHIERDGKEAKYKCPDCACARQSVEGTLTAGKIDPSVITVRTLPTKSEARKNVPLARGLLDYFPSALAAVAELSRVGNEKHNPGEELHHARSKSSDHADCILRHLVERGDVDPEDGILHDVKVAWRALAMLQEELERRGAPKARGAR